MVHLEGTYKYQEVLLPDNSRANKRKKNTNIVKGIIQMPLEHNWPGASITPLGSLFQCMITFTVKMSLLPGKI